MQWDEGTAVLFQSDEVFNKLTNGRAKAVGNPRVDPAGVSLEVSQCILQTASAGQPPLACLLDVYLGKERNSKLEDYFLYEQRVAEGGAAQGESMYIDSCEVYTGPAANLAALDPVVPGADQALVPKNEFQRCLINDRVNPCNIPQFVWSGRSKGKTPVAGYHSWTYSSLVVNNVDQRQQRAMVAFQVFPCILTHGTHWKLEN